MRRICAAFYQLFLWRLKDGADIPLCSKMSTGPVDIYEVKPFQRHLSIKKIFLNKRRYLKEVRKGQEKNL